MRTFKKYDELVDKIRDKIARGERPRTLTPEERIDWVYGNARIENPEVTREMAVAAVDKRTTATR